MKTSDLLALGQAAIGLQVIYVPLHACGDITHKDCQDGFVTSVAEDAESAFCRYWSESTPGELRTRANSEMTPAECLMALPTRPPDVVNAMLRRIQEGTV